MGHRASENAEAVVGQARALPKVNAHQRMFLRDLLRWQGVASSRDLGPQTSQPENSARQTCKRRGWVTYDGGNDGYWRITERGREAYRAAVSGDGVTEQSVRATEAR